LNDFLQIKPGAIKITLVLTGVLNQAWLNKIRKILRKRDQPEKDSFERKEKENKRTKRLEIKSEDNKFEVLIGKGSDCFSKRMEE
jgi:hypothetical protein